MVGKNPPNLIGWFEEKNQHFLRKTEQTSNHIGQGEATWENKQKILFFLARLLALLASRPCFCLVIDLAVGLTIALAIGKAVLISIEVAVSFPGWFLWNDLINFLRCWTNEKGSQVFSLSG